MDINWSKTTIFSEQCPYLEGTRMEPVTSLTNFDISISPDSCKDYRNGSDLSSLSTLFLDEFDVLTIRPKFNENAISVRQISFKISGTLCFKVTVWYKDVQDGQLTTVQYEKQVGIQCTLKYE